GTNQDSYRNNYQNNRQASHQNNVDQSDQNHIDQSSYDDAQGYDNFPPLEAYESASYSMDSYPSEPYSSNHADVGGYPPVWLTDNAAGMASIDQNADQDGNLYELLEQIQQFYQHNLHTHPHAKQYFLSRGLTEETFETFGLGYAPFGWQHLEHQFPQDIEGLKALGLVRQSESGRDYDLLRDRVIFPIRDNQGRTIGFGGRALDDEVKPKYINSSDSPVFHKQHVLYGYYESRQQRANDWLVVEGYMDVIALYQAGIYGAVASMGTAINESQISRLLTLNPTLTLSFDGDSAGQKAAWRTLEVALPVLADDKELRFLTLPNNHDPDTFIKSHGSDAMREQISQAMPLSQYIFAYLSERYDMSLAEGKAKLMSQVRSLTTALPKGSSFR
ncbi:MAG: DNA primase, partial [Psychrobacter sp.]